MNSLGFPMGKNSGMRCKSTPRVVSNGVRALAEVNLCGFSYFIRASPNGLQLRIWPWCCFTLWRPILVPIDRNLSPNLNNIVKTAVMPCLVSLSIEVTGTWVTLPKIVVAVVDCMGVNGSSPLPFIVILNGKVSPWCKLTLRRKKQREMLPLLMEPLDKHTVLKVYWS